MKMNLIQSRWSLSALCTLFSLFIFSGFTSQAADTMIKGMIIDESDQAVPYAAVLLYSMPDSVRVTGTTTDDQGYFEISAKKGQYLVKVSFLSYQDQNIPVTVTDERELEMGTIVMTVDAGMLDEVVVRAEKSEFELQLDKKVFNVGKDLASTGGNAGDILDRVPSVNVDVEGNVTLRGSGNVRILVNGKPSSLVANGDPQSMRQLQGNLIEKVEVITNPSSKYDAEGEVGILNIVLMEEESKGVNSSFDFATGWPHNHSAAVNMNWRKKWFNLFMSEGISYNRNPGGGFSLQQYTLEDTSYAFERIYDQTRSDLANNFRLGADFYVSDKDIITVSALYQFANGKNLSTTTYNDFDGIGTAVGTTERYQDEIETEHTVEVDLSYVKKFDKEDQEFSISAKFNLSQDFEDAEYVEDNFNTLSPVDARQRSDNLEYEKQWLFQTDYVHPFGNDGEFETGFKANIRNVDNDFLVEDEVSDGVFEPLEGFNNRFVYTENIYAAYAAVGEKFGGFSIKAGLRMEISDINTELIVTEEENPRNYVDFFPSVFLGQKIGEKNTLQLSYSRRISRPNFWSLLPFFQYTDTRNYFSGNPNLNPEYSHSVELGYQRYLKKGSFLTSVYYRYKTGIRERITFLTDDGIQRNIPINLGTGNSAGWEMSVSYDLTDWWSFNGNVNVYYWQTEGSFEGVDYGNETAAGDFKVSTEFTIADRLDLQPSFNYRSKRKSAQGISKSNYGLDFAAGLDVLKGKGKLTFSFRDILDSREWRWINETDEFRIEGDFQWRQGRQVLLSFNYRLEK